MLRTYAYWLDHGQPYRDAVIIGEIRRALVAIHGSDVLGPLLGTRGNTAHMKAQPPEDHTPFSHTGWPLESPFGVGHAIDWAGRDHARLGRHWIANRKMGTAPWWKYMNLGNVHYSWMPDYREGRSGDKHLHGSLRTDWSGRSLTHGWVPLRRGQDGASVVRLQRMLTAHPNLPDLADDGVFGPKTDACVRRLQDSRGLVVDGIAGPKTRLQIEVF